MDIDTSSSSNLPFEQGRVAAEGYRAAHGNTAIASGVGWVLVDHHGAMELRVAGASPLAVVDGRWRVTPRGRRLTAVTAQGPLILDVTPGVCRPVDVAPDRGLVSTTGFARITLPDGRQVHGCAFAAGPYADRAYPAR
jgi:hypothetical protein